jgi:hypothetical protein
MKFALTLLLAIAFTAAAARTPSGSTRFTLTKSQIEEFDETGWVTLTASQKSELQRRTGVAPTRVRAVYEEPDGEVAELGYNLALKKTLDQIEVFHGFLMSDEEAAKKHQQNLQMIAAGRAGTTKDVPIFAIDSNGHLWKGISRKEFEDYVARDPKNIMIVYIQVPSGIPSTNTVTSADTLRQLTTYCQLQHVPTYVISEH